MDNVKCVLYARVSSKEQDETGYSLDAQEKLLKDYAEKCGFRVKKLFRISESASGKQIRKTFNEMLRYATKDKIEVILCEKIDRLTRNLKDASTINDWINEDSNREVHFVKESFILNKNTRAHENLVWDMKAAIARFYTNNLSEEVKKGQKEKIAQGWLPTRPPIGYRTIGEKGHKTHIIDEDKANLIRKAFDLYSTGKFSIKKLRDEMFNLGLRSRSGNMFGKSRLCHILSDPFYYGKIRWNKNISDGQQKPLISKDIFDLVQTVLRSKNTPKYSKHRFLFKGFIKCHECGGKITWETHKGITYGHCNHYRNCSQETWAKEPDIDNQVVNILSKLRIKHSGIFEWVKSALKETHKDKIEFHSSAIKELEQRLNQLQNRLDKIYDDKLDGKISEEFYERKFKQFSEEREDIIDSIKKHSRSDTNYLQLSLNLFDLAQKAEEIYVSVGDIEKKRSLLRFIFKDLTSDEGILTYEFTEAFKLIAKATDYTNSSKNIKTAKLPEEIFEPSKNRLNKTLNGHFDANTNTSLRVCKTLRLKNWRLNTQRSIAQASSTTAGSERPSRKSALIIRMKKFMTGKTKSSRFSESSRIRLSPTASMFR